ncbi:hypothetical protein PNEG_00026 [Pneumocystis murina B123]|uniref:Cell division control protein 14 n=1 Tax=Pneumocystis murina (strain B123) TaxID=1069680 RepID=M7NWA6_PNEMU|nr:hypothetical protein PNEG_00026 [Pneumocystis murina B123]EMR11582.1 hypothetical protein PNEG_00026 [Pneumocystis murina B123]
MEKIRQNQEILESEIKLRIQHILSQAFDNLSSYDPVNMREGQRSIESLMAEICLGGKPGLKEFCELQDGFELNIATQLITCLERLLGKDTNHPISSHICHTLELLQGSLLLHPASRSLFSRHINMNILLDLLEPQSEPEVHIATLATLVAALVDNWDNVRVFESLNGLASVASLMKSKNSTQKVKLKVAEFLYFYLIPEPTFSGPIINKKLNIRRSTEEKELMLAKYLHNVRSLVKDLQELTPFGEL